MKPRQAKLLLKRAWALKLGLCVALCAVLGAGPARAQAQSQDETDAGDPDKSVPEIYELVPNLSPDPPNGEDVMRGLDQQYPTAGDILRAMREIPPLDPPRRAPDDTPAPQARDAGTPQ